jgi:transposase
LRPLRAASTAAHLQSQGKGEGKLKNGNKYLALGTRRGSEFAVRFCPEARRFLERKKARTKDIVATKVPASSGRARAVTL